MKFPIQELTQANRARKYFSQFNENPKSYPETAAADGLLAFQKKLNTNYEMPGCSGVSNWFGEEISPYLQTGLGIHYPKLSPETLISQAQAAAKPWRNLSPEERFEILSLTLEKVEPRFFEMAYATMHTTGQSFLMSFQASGPHACDRALEVMVTALEQLTYFPPEVEWVKNLGKFDLKLRKTFTPVPKGCGLLIGCSTFPTWNTVPGLYADLMTGNTAIVKPHPRAVYPIAIFVEEIRNVLIEKGLPADIVQLAVDSSSEPVTKILAEHPLVQIIDYTGSSAFGNYIESLGKTCFTEKAGINPVIIDSCNNLDAVVQNIAFSASLYSGQMCTAPQNIYIPADGINTSEGKVSFDEVRDKIVQAIKNLMENPKAAAPTLGAIQNDATIKRIDEKLKQHADKATILEVPVQNAEFTSARLKVPAVITTDASDEKTYMEECFGPLIFVIKTGSTAQSIEIVSKSAREHGAITCLAYTTSTETMREIEEKMNLAFTPVSFNFTGAAFVNQHAAFSDLHVSGGNPAGNATFTNTGFINGRYIWIGNRYML